MTQERIERAATPPADLSCEGLVVGYRPMEPPVLNGFSTRITPGAVTCVIGPNGCGKTTLLKALAGLLVPDSGRVDLNGKCVSDLPPRVIARSLGILFQENSPPTGLTVESLVRHGRYPHLGFLEPLDDVDLQMIEHALSLTGTGQLRHRRLEQLSGGQRQRVWIAMMLAQNARILLLDEPTTFLDMGHQLQIMRVVRDLSVQRDITVVAVMHDVNLAARFADDLLLLRDGALIAHGSPAEVLTPHHMRRAFGTTGHLVDDLVTGCPIFVADEPVDEA